MSPGTSNKPYQVLRIVEALRPSDIQGVEKYYQHIIKTRGGVRLTVDIDEADFTKDRADPILKQRAEAADEILAL